MDWWSWKCVCSVVYLSTTKIVQMMTLDRPWLFSQQSQIWENANTYDFMESVEDIVLIIVIGVVSMSTWYKWVEKVKVIVRPLTQDLP